LLIEDRMPGAGKEPRRTHPDEHKPHVLGGRVGECLSRLYRDHQLQERFL